MSDLTTEIINSAFERMRSQPVLPRIIETPSATERVWLFPESKNRSARVHKKLMKRHGTQYRERPAAYQMPDGTMLVHPEIMRQVAQHTRQHHQEHFDKVVTSVLYGGAPIYRARW